MAYLLASALLTLGFTYLRRPVHTAAKIVDAGHPKKLLLTKWTTAAPRDKEKHFVVVGVVVPAPPATRIDQVELEAVHSRRTFVLPWRDLTDGRQWRQGWV